MFTKNSVPSLINIAYKYDSCILIEEASEIEAILKIEGFKKM